MIMAKLEVSEREEISLWFVGGFHYCGVGCDSRDYRRRYRTVQYSAV